MRYLAFSRCFSSSRRARLPYQMLCTASLHGFFVGADYQAHLKVTAAVVGMKFFRPPTECGLDGGFVGQRRNIKDFWPARRQPVLGIAVGDSAGAKLGR